MAEHIFGNNERLDKHLMDEKADKPLEVQGNVNAQEIDHDKVCEEFAILLNTTKMDRHWRVLMMLRFSGADIEVALLLAQKHGFLKGVRVFEAQLIETAALQKMKETLRGKGIENRSDNLTIAVPEQGTPNKGEVCQN